MNVEKKPKTKGKKILKWVAIPFFILLIALFSIPFLMKDKIVQMAAKTVNKNINATVTFGETDISLFKNFPLASITLKDIALINKAPFIGDTLYSAKELSFSLKITELFKKADEVLEIKSIATKNGQVNIIYNKEGKANFDIIVKDKKPVDTSSPKKAFSLNIQEYTVENINFKYLDKGSNVILKLENIQHTGKGNFAKEILDLDTKISAKLSFEMNNVNYIQEVSLSLNAILALDLKNRKFTFKENTGYINQLPLSFNGFLQMNDEGQFYDLNFKTPNSSFKNLLALLPKQYAGDLKTIKTDGNFDLNGMIKGTLSNNSIPAFDISFAAKNAQFKYADLPKSVDNIYLDSKIINKTGKLEDTFVTLNKLTFKVDDDVFSANGNIAKITSNPTIQLAAKGTVNLANISKIYPAFKKELSGILTADITTNFDMNSVNKGNYKNIKNAGEIKVRDFKYEGKEVAKPFYIKNTGISFNTNTIKLNEFDAKTGTSDVSITGTLDNFYGFLFNNQVLKGDFYLHSNAFNIADFLTKAATSASKKTTEQLKIPAFLDCKFITDAKNVTYDNIQLKNVSGTLLVKDQAVELQNLKSDVFGGKLGFSGAVSTKEKVSTFNMDLDLKELNISDSFGNLEMLKSIAPIAKTIEGKINSTIKVSGNLKDDLAPNLKTISGKLFGQLLNAKLNTSNSKTLSLLGDKVPFLDLSKLNLDKITGFFSFENGFVSVKPIPLKYQDIGIIISGTHSFDNTMNYNLDFEVPVKYLGPEVTNLIEKLSPKEAKQIERIPVNATLTGSFSSPSFATNIKEATTNLIKDLVEKQKESLINKGKDKLTELLGNTTKKDSTKTNKTEEVKNLLNGLFKKKKKQN